jgi:KDO2-lipid IV(A) lauroyltransferase
MRRSSYSHRIEYLLARGLEALVSAAPESVSDRFASRVGSAAHSPLGIRRATVEANLRRAFPNASEEWLNRTGRGAFRHLGREAAAMLRLARLDAAAIRARTDVEGWVEFEAAAREGRGAILATGHFGNWEIGAATVAARGLPMSAIVKRQSNPLVDARLDSTRRRLGVETIDQREAPRAVPRALRAGKVVGIVADQDAWDAGVWVPFFGHPSSTHRGPALFALRLGAPIFAAAAYRIPGALRYRVTFERVIPRRTDSLESDIVQLTADLTARLEAAIRMAPEQYFWFHKRWKSLPPTELPPGGPGTTFPGGAVIQLEDGSV